MTTSVIAGIIQAGVDASKPTLTTNHEGYLYFATDTVKLYRWSGSAWVATGAPAGSYIKVDGSVAFTGDQSMGSHKLTNVNDPASAQDAATKAYVDSIAVNLGKRARVRAATTANITISAALNNADTLDGITLATGDLVLVKDQSAAEENGIYVVGSSPARFSEFDTYDEHPGSLIVVEEGTANADTLWLCTSNVGGTIGVTAINFSQFVVSSGNIEDSPTAETNTALVLAPDGLGGVEFRAETGGGGGLHSIDDPTDAYWAGGDLGFDLEFDANTSSLPSGVGWINQDSSTYTERGGAGTIARASQAGDHNYLLTRSLSGAPSTWLMTGKFSIVAGAGNYIDGGFVIRESGSGKFMSLIQRNYATSVLFKWDAPTTFNGAPTTLATLTISTFYFRIRKNSGSSFDFEFGHDGLSWRTVQAAYNVGAYITPDEYGFEMLNGSGEAGGVSCHWIRLR